MKAFTLATMMTLAASPVFAFNLSDAANAVSSMQNQKQQGQVQAPEGQANLLNTLGSQLNITPEQAVGGAGAMLGLARNNLSSDDYGQLTKAVPGLDLLSGANALGGLSGLGELLGNDKGSQLNITPEQAVGGAGAMLGLARNNLSSDDYGQLTKAVPGLDLLSGANALGGLSGLGELLGSNKGNQSALDKALGNDVENRGDLDNAFKALGMDTGMIGQFAPLILQYLGQQGIAGSLLKNLGSLWTTPAPVSTPSV